MAKRKHKRIRGDILPSGLENPSPSAPVRPGLYNVYVRTHEYETTDSRYHFYCFIYCTMYAVKRVIDELIQDQEYDWVDDDRIRLPNGVDIRIPLHMKDALAYELSDTELEWQPAPNEQRMIYVFCNDGEQMPAAKQKEIKTAPPPVAPQPKKAHKRKPDTDGMITAVDIAAEIGKSSREVRGILRKAAEKGQITKPDHGWAWTKDEVDAARKIIKKG